MLREYEFILITRPDLQDADLAAVIKKYEAFMTADGGSIIAKNDWGVKKLSYPIGKYFRGRYAIYDFAGNPDQLPEMERLLRIDENVVRYLNVKLADEVDPAARKLEIAKAAAAAQAAEARAAEDM